MNKKSYTAIILAAAMVASSPAGVFAQEADTQISSEAKAADDVSDQSLSEQPWLPVLPAAAQAQEFKMISFADTEAVDQDGILSRTVADEENGLYVITYGDEEHPVLDADKNEITDEYIDAHFEEIKSHGSDIETRLDDSNCSAEQLKQDNHQIIDGYQSNGEQITLITESFDDSIRGVLD